MMRKTNNSGSPLRKHTGNVKENAGEMLRRMARLVGTYR